MIPNLDTWVAVHTTDLPQAPMKYLNFPLPLGMVVEILQARLDLLWRNENHSRFLANRDAPDYLINLYECHDEICATGQLLVRFQADLRFYDM